MKVICAWCQAIIKPDDGYDLPDSHGICPGCKEIYYPVKKRQKDTLDKNKPIRTRIGNDGRRRRSRP